MGMHLWDSITHLALWLARMPEGKMGVRKGTTLLLPLTVNGPQPGYTGREARMQARSNETNHLNNLITIPERTRPNEEVTKEGITTSTKP